MADEWWCVPDLTRKQRKQKGLRRQPKPRRTSRDECWPFGFPEVSGTVAQRRAAVGSAHWNCGYRDPLGRIIPWFADPHNPNWSD